MPAYDPRVDAYIARSADFAQPILKRLRALVHKACPGAEETVKWGMPFFLHEGSILCCMAAFKAHCALRFWNASKMKDPRGVMTDESKSMGHFGRIPKLSDLPSAAVLTALLREAVRLAEAGESPIRDRFAAGRKGRPSKEMPLKKSPGKETGLPPVLLAALKKNRKARTAFEAFSPGKRKDYAAWIGEAKTEATRAKRLETALEWIAEGKSRNWKYEKKPNAK